MRAARAWSQTRDGRRGWYEHRRESEMSKGWSRERNRGALCSVQGEPSPLGQNHRGGRSQPWEGSGPGLWGQPRKGLCRHLAGDKLLPQVKEPTLLRTGKSKESAWTEISQGGPAGRQAGERHGSSQLPREQHVFFLPRSPWKMPQRPLCDGSPFIRDTPVWPCTLM